MIGSRIGSRIGSHVGAAIGLGADAIAPSGVTLVVIAGQSQAEGVADVTTLSAPNAFYGSPYAPVQYMAHIDGNTDPPTFLDFAKQSLGPITYNSASRMGVELSLGRTLDRSFPGRFAIAKMALDSTTLAVDWNATGTYPTVGPNLATLFRTYVLGAMSTMGASRVIFVWNQGGSDASGSGTATPYQANLTAFTAFVRAVFHGAPFVIAKLNSDVINSGVCPAMTTVQAAEVAYVAGDANSVLVNEDAILPSADHLHPTADGYVAIGILYAKAVAGLLGLNLKPTAAFTFTTSTLTASFTDASSDLDGTIVSWSWAFGDGATSTVQNPSHTYAATGTYTATLTATDNKGRSDTVANTNVAVSAQGWTVDATSGKGIPQSASEWAAFLASISDTDGNPASLYLLQEPSGNPADSIGAFPLTASGTGITYQQPVGGWSTKAIDFTDGGSGTLASTSASLVDASTSDELLLVYLATPLAGLRSLATVGSGPRVEAEISATPKLFLVNGVNSVTSTNNPIGPNVFPIWLQSSATLSVQNLYSLVEKMIGTYSAAAGKRISIGAFGRTSPQMPVLYAVRWTGAAAQKTSTKLKAILTGLGWTGITWS